MTINNLTKQGAAESLEDQSKQLDCLNRPTSMSNPFLNWTDLPDIPQLQVLDSPQVWVTGDFLPDNELYNTTSTCDFPSNFSSTSSPLLGESDTFGTFANTDISLHQLIPTIESNDGNDPSATRQEQLAMRNGLFPLDHTKYCRPSSPTSAPQNYLETSTFDNVKVSCSNRAKTPINRSQRHPTVGSDTPSSQDSDEERVTERRRRNKLAARRLRQKKLDQVSKLEAQLEEVKKERDALRLRAAKSEGEVMALRQMID